MKNYKKLSILGDSLSTYKGVSDDRSINSQLYYNRSYYDEPFPLNKTYWSILMERMGMTLCVNNSYSGGNLSDRENPDSGVNRAKELSRDNGETPDLIIVFMGTNDLGRRVPPEVFSADYEKTLEIISEKYPEADVCCVNIADKDPVMKKRAQIFNDIIYNAVNKFGEKFFLVDLFNSYFNNDFYYNNTLDGLHPAETGMQIIADIIYEVIEKRQN